MSGLNRAHHVLGILVRIFRSLIAPVCHRKPREHPPAGSYDKLKVEIVWATVPILILFDMASRCCR